MSQDDLKPTLEAVSNRIAKLEQKVDAAPKPKDTWDKAGVVAQFMGTVLLAGVGLTFTDCYKREEAKHRIQADSAQRREAAVDLVSKFMPQLTSKDDLAKRFAFVAINSLGNTQLALDLAAADHGPAAAAAMGEIATAEGSTPKTRRLATRALGALATTTTVAPDAFKVALLTAGAVASSPNVSSELRDSAIAIGKLVSVVKEPPTVTIRSHSSIELMLTGPATGIFALWYKTPMDSSWRNLGQARVLDSVARIDPVSELRAGQLAYHIIAAGNPQTTFTARLFAVEDNHTVPLANTTETLNEAGSAIIRGTIDISVKQ
jgi:hypothetical protein